MRQASGAPQAARPVDKLDTTRAMVSSLHPRIHQHVSSLYCSGECWLRMYQLMLSGLHGRLTGLAFFSEKSGAINKPVKGLVRHFWQAKPANRRPAVQHVFLSTGVTLPSPPRCAFASGLRRCAAALRSMAGAGKPSVRTGSPERVCFDSVVIWFLAFLVYLVLVRYGKLGLVGWLDASTGRLAGCIHVLLLLRRRGLPKPLRFGLVSRSTCRHYMRSVPFCLKQVAISSFQIGPRLGNGRQLRHCWRRGGGSSRQWASWMGSTNQ